ncbi:MAG TPA: GNAT family N-acetyltransferase, partial [Klebsiella pneumoniae]|nr:GNAT family N-acetyltransferase [Klebsiella pneumoniae]
MTRKCDDWVEAAQVKMAPPSPVSLRIREETVLPLST